jgi:hypothetical protein
MVEEQPQRHRWGICSMKVSLILTFDFILSSLAYSQAYYPISVGNRWDYGYLDFPGHFVHTRTVQVISDTLLPNGKRFAALSDGSFLRQEGDTVFSYSIFHGESILYDLSRRDGDTIKTYYPFDTLITVVYRGPGNVFGKSTTIWFYYTKSTRSSFYSFIDIADSIGYIYGQWEPGENEYCLGAIIDGVQYGTISGIPGMKESIPDHWSLLQNYPNPFNPSTTIPYSLPVRSSVTLTVFDLLGRRVSILQEAVQNPGDYTLRFDGSSLAGGIYFFRLQADGFSQTRSMILMK